MNLINKNHKTPKVSIFCMVYNHEPFIRECIEGFLMQKCNFDFEIVLGEDCSTDNSREIILEYANKFPEKFKLFLHDKNIGAAQNQKIVFENCTGKYIAMCEGDDYWTNPLKLQKQVDFLENNDDYVLSFTKSMELFQNKGILIETIYPQNIDNLNFQALLFHEWFIRTATIVFVKNRLDLDFLLRLEYSADYFLQLLLISKGKFHFLNETTSVYRHHSGGISNSTKDIFIKRRVWFCDNLILFNKYTNNNYNEIILKRIREIEIDILDFAILNFKINYFYLIKANNIQSIIAHFTERIKNKFF